MALMAHKSAASRLQPDARQIWEKEAASWLADAQVQTAVSLQNDEVIGGLFVRLEPNTIEDWPARCAVVLALVIDLHTTHQRHGVGRVLVQALRELLHQMGITRLYAAALAGDMLETTFWPSLGATPVGQWFRLDI